MNAGGLFLAIIGMAYLLLAGWCLAQPATTAQSVGFELARGSGESEYAVLYGGLQLGLAYLFLQPVWRPDSMRPMLEVCVILHGGIVVVRLVTFFLYSGIQPTTYVLAIVESAILIGGAAVWWRSTRGNGQQPAEHRSSIPPQ